MGEYALNVGCAYVGVVLATSLGQDMRLAGISLVCICRGIPYDWMMAAEQGMISIFMNSCFSTCTAFFNLMDGSALVRE